MDPQQKHPYDASVQPGRSAKRSLVIRNHHHALVVCPFLVGYLRLLPYTMSHFIGQLRLVKPSYGCQKQLNTVTAGARVLFLWTFRPYRRAARLSSHLKDIPFRPKGLFSDPTRTLTLQMKDN